MRHAGLQMGDFENQKKALALADELIESNQKEFNHSFKPKLHDNPLLRKYWYVFKHAKTSKWSSKESTGIGQKDDKANLAKIKESGVLSQLLGEPDETAKVKTEFVCYEKLKEEAANLRY